ncbi:radical SAM/SPASM domain-containing protein [Actinomadura formosensis]|uniref:radical SAM/SPASM domain-containing protein n=1 Tax=Actinomadura formosensis TaxID=60706 RepID=UPI000B2674B6|nr:radical SAM/SPASM domain-containing protein [Actinomadura formosensis]
MHDVDQIDHESAMGPAGRGLGFLWLELTNRCNLKCVHCYTESHPGSGGRDIMTARDYESVMTQAYELGCRKIQFIGGEPQISPDFMRLLRYAKETGFEFVEVFTNLTRLTEETLGFATRHGVRFATSVYSRAPEAHDGVTGVRSSHVRTIKNLRRLITSGVETRAAVVDIRQDATAAEEAQRFLEDLGVGSVRTSRVREFGRGEALTGQQGSMSALCGHCWNGKLCIAPDGLAYPCVMARQWPVGNALTETLARIVTGGELRSTRKAIFEEAWLPRTPPPSAHCDPCPQSCDPDISSCPPNSHVCNPIACPQSCSPQDWCGPPSCMPTPDIPQKETPKILPKE